MFGGERKKITIANLLVRIHFIIVMIRWTGLAPWEFGFPVPGSLTSTFLERRGEPTNYRALAAPERTSTLLSAYGIAYAGRRGPRPRIFVRALRATVGNTVGTTVVGPLSYELSVPYLMICQSITLFHCFMSPIVSPLLFVY